MPAKTTDIPQNDLTIDQKRLDTLAKILECSSMCIAVIQLNGIFIISANEFNKKTQDAEGNQKLKLIIEIMHYFQNIANQKISHDDDKTKTRNVLMEHICSARLNVLGQGKLNIPVEAIRKFITTERLETATYPKTAECAEFQQKTKMSNISTAFFDMLIIYRKILKIEHSINHALNNKFDKITSNHLNAFKNFDKHCILREGTTKSHAEMQILGKLIEEKKIGRLHIGISKFCCVQCKCVLDITKEFLKQKNSLLSISYKGTHGRSFGANWSFPDNFYDGNNAELKTAIREEYFKRIKKEAESTGMYNQYEDTDSEPGLSQDSSRQKINYQHYLERNQAVFNLMTELDRDKTINEHISLINFGLNLLKKESFIYLFELSKDSKNAEIIKVVDTLIFDLSSSSSDADDLLKLLNSGYFPETNNRDKITAELKTKLRDKHIMEESTPSTTIKEVRNRDRSSPPPAP